MRRQAATWLTDSLPDGCELATGWEMHMRAVLGFYLVAKLFRVGLYALYGLVLPRSVDTYSERC